MLCIKSADKGAVGKNGFRYPRFLPYYRNPAKIFYGTLSNRSYTHGEIA